MYENRFKPAHKPIKDYYKSVASLSKTGAKHETALRAAFQELLTTVARKQGWTFVPENPVTVKGHRVVPDGTLLNEHNIPRGYWEAKDLADDLDAEIQKKKTKDYPLNNIIFENGRDAVLYQNGIEVSRKDLTDAEQLCQLLNIFIEYTPKEMQTFAQAVAKFKEDVPELAAGLEKKITKAHEKNPAFKKAFADFFELCRSSLNPNISQHAVDEMLVQHLLTQRLFRTVFHRQDFTRRNVIANEVEKVIDSLHRDFDRSKFERDLDYFYKAIEQTARTLEDYSQKQAFMNTVYEEFFKGFSPKTADTHGIVYTPQEIVDFMCASVDEVLQSEFGTTLGGKDVWILDPCTGTGNFMVNLINRIPLGELKDAYRKRLFANEIMLLPYYIAAMNIEHAYAERMGEYEPFEGLCFVDTLELAEDKQRDLFLSLENSKRVERQRKSPITVIIGNPPYNVGQKSENDQNKNRKYGVIDKRVKETYSADSKATNKNALSDAYVKFFRWAVDRLQGRDGIVCYVSNNSFVDQIAFDGMRKHLANCMTTSFRLGPFGGTLCLSR
ncbi:MAG: N-6 DNA methylase [Planctomycetes bacterium]|nr:N-6 DNA methylase [Planctomycetota bacterium]